LRSRVIGKPQPIKAHLRTKKAELCTLIAGFSNQLEGSHRETSTCRPCCRILFLNRFHECLVHRQSPIWNCLNLFRGPDGKWRESCCERHDCCAQNSSVWNAGTRNPSAQRPLGGRPN